MASILPGFEYDIFISYRHNDNRSGWVTEFVKALQEELAATIKEPVSVYFDSNPHDGLLETHDVDKSLEGKLKCLIFIPVLSQTYCDPKSFAWENEFVAFNKAAKGDQFGRDIRLGNGNVASRILPIKIHDLDTHDKALLETEIGGFLRAIEFVFSSPGVNRPLTPADNPDKNQSGTLYRDQINKVARNIKDLISAIQKPAVASTSSKTSPLALAHPSNRSRNSLIAAGLIALGLITFSMFYLMGWGKKLEPVIDKSIAVLPFTDMSANHDQEFFGDGVADEIINALVQVNDLKVIARTSSFQFKGKNEDLRIIGERLGVATVLEGSVKKSNNQLRITAQLIKTSDGSHLWSKSYDRNSDDIFKVQDEIAQAVVQALKVTLSKSLQPANAQTKNKEAYDLYLRGRFYYDRNGMGDTERSLSLFNEAKTRDSLFAQAWDYYAIASWRLYPDASNPNWEELKAANRRAIELNPDVADFYGTLALIDRFDYNMEAALEAINKGLSIDPRNPRILRNSASTFTSLGEYQKGIDLAQKATSMDPLQPLSFWNLYRAYYCAERLEEADSAYNKIFELTPNFKDPWWVLGRIFLKLTKDGPDAVLQIVKSGVDERVRLGGRAIANFALGRKQESDQALDEFIAKYQKTNASDIAQIYSYRGEVDEAFKWLDQAFVQKESGVTALLAFPVYKNLRKDPRCSSLLKKMKFPERF